MDAVSTLENPPVGLQPKGDGSGGYDFELPVTLVDEKMVDNYHHVKHCTTHPKFLHSNSTSHRWVFGAIAELIDNAIDPDVSASQFCIDMKEFNGEPCLVFMDNGCGLVPEKLHKMLSFGHSKKQMSSGDRSIGKHGNGFKSGTMRLGKDVLVLTKCADSMTVGFLSQTFLEDTKSEDILIPQVSWDLNGNRLSPFDLEVEESLRAIYKYSMFPDEESLLAQLQAIPVTGAILIISNLRRHEGVLELDFDTDEHDIRIASEINSSHFQQLRPNQPNTTEVPMDYSLLAYVSILYKVPRMQIFIRDKKVKTKRIAGILSQKETENYKPTGVGESIKIELGFNTENKSLYGMMLYHRNRLIKAYMRVGMQLEENERGMGVIGLAEADFLQPTHNKQEFDDTTAYRRLLKKLSDVLAEYWWEKKERVHEAQLPLEPRALRRDINGSTSEDVPDVIWVQCDNPTCLKWRVLPPGTDVSILPDIWYCEYHPDAKFRVHEEPEQEWDPSVRHEIVERRKERKREYDREKKEREAERKRQRLEAVAKEKHMEEDKEKQVKELAKQVASLSAEKAEIMRKLEKAQAELFRKAKEKEDGVRLSTQQVQSEQPGEKLYSLNASTNGHATPRQQDSPPPLSIGNKEHGNLRGFRGTEDRMETGMPRRRLHRRASVPVSASPGVHQPALQSNGHLHGHVASGSPSPNAFGNSRRSALAPKAVTQGSRHVQATTSINALSKDLVVRGSSEGPQHSQRKGRTLSSVNDRALVLHGSSAEKRRRISTGSVASQRADVHLPSTQVVDNRHSMPLGEVLLGAGTPVPSTPSRGFPSSKNPAFSPAQQMCSLNQESQTLVAMDQRSPLLADSAWQDRVSPPVAANGASVVLRSRDKFTEQGVEHSPESHQSMDSGNGRHARPDNGAPSSGLRFAPPQTQNSSGILSVDLPVDSTVSASNDRSETELTREFFKTQRQFRLAINTLRKIGGAGDSDLVELDSLPVEDSEVVDICETANQNHETMLQNGRQEAAKLKAELAYLMVDKMQHGQGQNFKIQSVANNWGIGVDVPRQM